MNYCTHGGLAMNIAPGTRCPWCSTQIVAAAPMRQATSGEVGGDARHATEPAPRTIAASAPTPATSPQPPLPGRGTPSANAHHGADAAPSLLDLIDATPRARVTDPDTAHQAAGFQAGRLTHDMRIVLAAHVAAGERGLTGPELATATRRTYEQIGPRRKPLEVAGLVEKAERRPKDPTQPAGSLVWAYRITDLGRDTYAREQARSNAA